MGLFSRKPKVCIDNDAKALISITPAVINLFKYSFEPIGYNYDSLTLSEKRCIKEADFNVIKKLCGK